MSAEDQGEADFEYEAEDTEAEDAEAGDEAWEAGEADEGDEGSDEGAYEAAEAGDESDEAVPMFQAMEADEADEGDEASDEADEADEAVQLNARAQLRATQDRNRRAEWARKVAADRRAETQRAQSAQRALTSRIRAIPIATRARVVGVGSLQGAGVVTAILPNGRRTRMRIVPTVAPIAEVNRLRAVVLANEKRQAAAIATNAKAVASLASAQTTAVQRLTAHQLKTDKELSRRLVEGDNRIDARITKELSGSSGILEKYNKRMTRIIRRERWRNRMNSAMLATAMPFFVSYGDRELLTWDNGILFGSTLLGLFGDDAIGAVAPKQGFVQGLATGWSFTAPILYAGGMYLVFRNKQNQRFIAGIQSVTLPAAAANATVSKSETVPLSKYIKQDAIDDFTGRTVVASFLSTPPARGTVGASVAKDGTLTLTATSTAAADAIDAKTVSVAWLLDTQPEAKPRAS